MKSQRKNRQIPINLETFYTLELIKNQMFSKFNKLMSEDEAKNAYEHGYFMSEPMPYPFIFSPNLDDDRWLKDVKNGETVELTIDDMSVAAIKVNGIYKNSEKYSCNIFNPSEYSKIPTGKYCIGGEIEIYKDSAKEPKEFIENLKKELNAKKITAVMLTADPLHRAHERLIRMTIDKADLVIIFLLQSNNENSIKFELRHKSVLYFIENYLPHNRVVIMPFKTSIFTSHQNPALECIAAHNLGATKLVIGQNHAGIGMFYDKNQPKTILDRYINDLNMEIIVLPELVYCNECKTIVSTKSCPHGQHHHIKYRPDTIKSLLFNGIMPPAILMRPDISALILSEMFKNRFNDIQRLCDELFPNSGLLEKRTECDFYKDLMRLYQTSSLT